MTTHYVLAANEIDANPTVFRPRAVVEARGARKSVRLDGAADRRCHLRAPGGCGGQLSASSSGN